MRALVVGLLIAAGVAGIGPRTALTAPATQDAVAVAPQSIRISHALVDTAIEPLAITEGIAEAPTSPWSVGWYRDTGGLGVPGNVVVIGYPDLFDVGPSVFWFLDQTVVDQEIDVTGDDGNRYRYAVRSVERDDRDTAPLELIFAASGDESLTLLTDTEPYDAVNDEYTRLLVVRAVREPGPPAAAPAVGAADLDGTAGCPVAPLTLDLPLASAPAPDKGTLALAESRGARRADTRDLDALLAAATACDIGIREALVLPDGRVLALVGPSGALTPELLAGAIVPEVPFVEDETVVVDETLAGLFAFLLFVEEGGAWRVAPLTTEAVTDAY